MNRCVTPSVRFLNAFQLKTEIVETPNLLSFAWQINEGMVNTNHSKTEILFADLLELEKLYTS